MKQECQNCYYGRDGGNSVACRRFPPMVTKTEGDTVTSTFPLMPLTGWCGEWRKKQSKMHMGSA